MVSRMAFYRLILKYFLFLFSVLLLSCGGKIGGYYISSSFNTSGITISNPLIASIEIKGKELIPTFKGLTAPLDGATASAGIWATGGLKDVSFGATGPLEMIKDKILDIAAFDATEDFKSSITFPIINNFGYFSCSVLDPFSSIDCLVKGFSISKADISISGEIYLSIESRLGESFLWGPKSTKRFIIKQVSNTVGNNLASDMRVIKLYKYKNKLYFTSNNSNLKNKIYQYDDVIKTLVQLSNTTGDHRVSDTSDVLNAVIVNDRMFFEGTNTRYVTKLFRYDEATNTLLQISNSSGDQGVDDRPGKLLKHNNEFYLALDNNSGTRGYKLYSYHDANSTLTQISNTHNNIQYDDNPFSFIIYNNKLFFISNKGVNGKTKLYSYDSRSRKLSQITNFTGSDNIADFRFSNLIKPTIYNNKLFFIAQNSNQKNKLFSYDDNKGVVKQVSNTVCDDNISDNPREVIIFNDKLYFTANNWHKANKLFSYDDKTGVLIQISNTSSEIAYYDNMKHFQVLNDKLFFVSNNSDKFQKLFYLSSSDNKIYQVSNTVNNQRADDGIEGYAIYNNSLYFVSNNPSGVRKMFFFDQKDNRVVQVTNTRGDNSIDDSVTLGMTSLVYNNKLFFMSRNSLGAKKLYSLCDTALGCEP